MVLSVKVLLQECTGLLSAQANGSAGGLCILYNHHQPTPQYDKLEKVWRAVVRLAEDSLLNGRGFSFPLGKFSLERPGKREARVHEPRRKVFILSESFRDRYGIQWKRPGTRLLTPCQDISYCKLGVMAGLSKDTVQALVAFIFQTLGSAINRGQSVHVVMGSIGVLTAEGSGGGGPKVLFRFYGNGHHQPHHHHPQQQQQQRHLLPAPATAIITLAITNDKSSPAVDRRHMEKPERHRNSKPCHQAHYHDETEGSRTIDTALDDNSVLPCLKQDPQFNDSNSPSSQRGEEEARGEYTLPASRLISISPTAVGLALHHRQHGGDDSSDKSKNKGSLLSTPASSPSSSLLSLPGRSSSSSSSSASPRRKQDLAVSKRSSTFLPAIGSSIGIDSSLSSAPPIINPKERGKSINVRQRVTLENAYKRLELRLAQRKIEEAKRQLLSEQWEEKMEAREESRQAEKKKQWMKWKTHLMNQVNETRHRKEKLHQAPFLSSNKGSSNQNEENQEELVGRAYPIAHGFDWKRQKEHQHMMKEALDEQIRFKAVSRRRQKEEDRHQDQQMAEYARQREETFQKRKDEQARENARVLKEWEWQIQRRDTIQRELGLEKIG